MSSDTIALLATDAEALKQRLDTLVASTSSFSVLMPLDIVALLVADAKVPKQWLDALVAATEAVEEKAAAARRHVLATRQLLDKEQAAAKKLVPGSTFSSTTEIVTTYPSYIDTIIVNFHIQADTMMEEIHLDISGPAAALRTFYSNNTSPAPLSPPLASPRPPGKNNCSGPGNGNGSNNNENRNNNCRNDDIDGKNSNTTVASHSATTNDGRGPPPWPTYVNPSPGHICHVPWHGAHRPPALAGFHGHDGVLHPIGLCPRAATAVPAGPSCASSGLGTLEQHGLGPAVTHELLQHHDTSRPTTWSMTGLPTPMLHTTPLIQLVISSTLIF
jgi:hypothetical protein